MVAFSGRLPESEMISFRRMYLGCKYKVSLAFTVGKLPEHQNTELVPAGKLLDITIPTVFVCYSEEYILIYKI